MQLETKYLSTKEAGRYLGFSHKTLEAWRTTGTGPEYVKLQNGHVRYSRSQLEEWIHTTPTRRAA